MTPETSRPGTTVVASGTGYVAGTNVQIKYAAVAGVVTSVNADSSGAWTKDFVVPVQARIANTYTVTAESGQLAGDGEAGKSATAEHMIPGGMLSVSPSSSGLPGDQIIVSGNGFTAYAAVTTMTIGGLSVLPGNVNTDADGNFAASVLVPALPQGTHSLFVRVGSANSADTDNLVFTIAPTPVITTEASADAFADLATAGVLTVVWYWDNDKKDWFFYDPRPEVADAVDLTEVTSGDNVWIQVTADMEFQGETLTTGWSLVTLD